MASVTDILTTLAEVIAQALYPNGTGQASVAGVPVAVRPGWPIQSVLDSDLAAGKCNVTIYPRPEERNTSRYPQDWQQLAITPATLTATIAGQTVTIGGTVGTPQNVVVFAGNRPFVYQVQAGDTLTGIATGLATLIALTIPGTTNTGPVITLPNSAVLEYTRIGTGGTMVRETRRQEKRFQISVWADTPAHRDAVANPIDVALAPLRFITLPDGFAARLIYHHQVEHDEYQKARLYRRDFFYTVEWATTESTGATTVTQTQQNDSLIIAGTADTSPIGTLTTYQ